MKIYKEPRYLVLNDNDHLEGYVPAITHHTLTQDEILFGKDVVNGQIVIDSAKKIAYITKLKTDIINKLQTEVKRRKDGYVGIITFSQDNKQYYSGTDYEYMLSVVVGQINAGINPALLPGYRDITGKAWKLTPTQFRQMLVEVQADMLQKGAALYNIADSKVKEVMALTTINSLNNYSTTSGWNV